MTNAAKIEANEAVVVETPNTPHDLVPAGFRQWVPPAMPVKAVEDVADTSGAIPAKRRPLVYLAGPYTKGSPETNTRCQRRIADALMSHGIVVPYSPLSETHEMHLQSPRPYEDWMDHSFAMLSRCDALLRSNAEEGSYFEHESFGADREQAYCHEHGIPVFVDRKNLYEWAKRWEEKQPIRTFETGATRNLSTTKINPAKALSPLVIQRYSEYMRDMRKQKDGTLRADDNWQKGISLESFVESGQRHSLHWWMIDAGHKYLSEDDGHEIDVEEACCALMFNVMGYLHESLKAKRV